MDIIIAGAGVSAMLLADSLIRRRCFRTLRIVGRRQPLRAHRLSYWSEGPTPFDEYNDAAWAAVRIVDASGAPTESALSRFRYRSFRTAKWFEELEQRVRASPGVELIDVRVTSVSSKESSALVHSDTGEYEAEWVFASIPEGAERPAFWQRFEGWEVSVPEGTIDERVATLLDFRTPLEDDFRFVYMLPISPTRLFVEHVSYDSCDHGGHLSAYLSNVLGLSEWTIIDRERGATPAHRHAPARIDRRLVHIGVAGGMAKAATGYALMRMWRDGESIAEGLARDGVPTPVHGPRGLYRLADRYFLHLLAGGRAEIPGLLDALFKGASGDAVLAFLDDRATLSELARVSFAVPGWMQWWARHGQLAARAS